MGWRVVVIQECECTVATRDLIELLTRSRQEGGRERAYVREATMSKELSQRRPLF